MAAGLGALIAQIVFWSFLVWGVLTDSFSRAMTLVFAVLWLSGYWGLSRVASGDLFTSYVAVLDVVLVLIVAKGDVRLR
jgi:hypothetical protein